MPVVRLYYQDMERLIGASRETIMSRLAMMGADIGKRAEEEYVDVEFFPDRTSIARRGWPERCKDSWGSRPI